MRIIRHLTRGGTPGDSAVEALSEFLGKDTSRGFLRPIAAAELFNKKIKTDVWALVEGISSVKYSDTSDSLIHRITDLRLTVSELGFVGGPEQLGKPTIMPRG